MRRTHIIVKARFAAPLANPTRSRRCTPCADEASCRRCNTDLRHRVDSEDDGGGESGYKAPPRRVFGTTAGPGGLAWQAGRVAR